MENQPYNNLLIYIFIKSSAYMHVLVLLIHLPAWELSIDSSLDTLKWKPGKIAELIIQLYMSSILNTHNRLHINYVET